MKRHYGALTVWNVNVQAFSPNTMYSKVRVTDIKSTFLF